MACVWFERYLFGLGLAVLSIIVVVVGVAFGIAIARVVRDERPSS